MPSNKRLQYLNLAAVRKISGPGIFSAGIKVPAENPDRSILCWHPKLDSVICYDTVKPLLNGPLGYI